MGKEDTLPTCVKNLQHTHTYEQIATANTAYLEKGKKVKWLTFNC